MYIFICQLLQMDAHNCKNTFIGIMSFERQGLKMRYARQCQSDFQQALLHIKSEIQENRTCWQKLKCFFCGQPTRIFLVIQRNIQKDLYLKAFSQILAVEYYSLKGKMCKRIKQYADVALYYQQQFFDKLSGVQKIVILEKRAQYDQQLNYYQQLLNLYQKFPQYNSQKDFQNVYSKIYKLSPENKRINVLLDWISFQQKQASPYIQAVITFAQKQKVTQADLLFAHISGRRISQAWKLLLFLKKLNTSQYFTKYAIILAMIDLHQHKELLTYAREQDYLSEQKTLQQASQYLRENFENESGQDKIKNTLKCIELYQQYSCDKILVQAYTQMIQLLTFGYPHAQNPNETQQSRDERILELYEKVIDIISIDQKKQKRIQKINRYFSGALSIVLKQKEPNYAFLLKVLKKYSTTSFSQALVYICMKDFENARIMIQCGRIGLNYWESYNHLQRIAFLMENKKHEDLKQYMNGLHKSNEVWERNLRKRIIEIAEREEKEIVSIL